MIVRQEIQILEELMTAASGSVADSKQTAVLDTNNFSGSCTYYLEVITWSDVSIAYNIRLRRFGTTTDDCTINIPTGTTSATLFTQSFTPPAAAATEYFVRISNTTGANKSMYSARIVIVQDTGASSLTDTETQIELGAPSFSTTSTTGASTGNYWKYDSANYDGSITAVFEAVLSSSSTKNTVTAKLQVDNGSFASWTDVTNASVSIATLAGGRVRAGSAFTLTSGRNYRVLIVSGNSKSSATIYSAKVILTQTGTITKFEAQYYCANWMSGTGLQGNYVNWDTTHWSGVTNVYKFAVDVSGATSTSVCSLKTANDVTTIATVSSPANQGVTTIVSMPTTQNLDVKPTTNSGDMDAERILVFVTKTPAAGGFIPRLTLMGVG